MTNRRDEFVANLKKQLDEWNAKIDALEVRARQQAGEAEVQADRGLAELRKRREELQRKLREIREASGEAWSDLIEGAEHARDAVGAAFKRARSRYEE